MKAVFVVAVAAQHHTHIDGEQDDIIMLQAGRAKATQTVILVPRKNK